MKIDILGVEYCTTEVPADQLEGKAGETDFYTKEIRLSDLSNTCVESMTGNVTAFKKDTLKHEIIHAFLFESGLGMQSGETDSWAQNETMVDWMALQFPKILRAFNEAKCL